MFSRRRRDRPATPLGLLAALTLAACSQAVEVSDLPEPRPAGGAAPVVEPPAETRLDPALLSRYASTEAGLVSRGLLRTDVGTEPDDADRLTESFLRIALFDEYTNLGDRFVAREQVSRLRRWEDPVRIALQFGASVPQEIRDTDTQTVAEVASRLDGVSGHPIRVAARNGNFDIFVVSEAERRALGPDLAALIPGLPDAVVNQIIDMPEGIFCLVIAFSDQTSRSVYRRAVAVIRAELPPLLRRSCYDEEIAQGLGLANDSREVRPSLFNDDKEFARLTRQDELLLTMLYDPRLRPGMSLEEARPVARDIAEDLLPPPPSGGAAPSPAPQET